MSDKWLGECEQARKKLHLPDNGCCDSCHEDNEEFGYEMIYIDTPEGFFTVCCNTAIERDKNDLLAIP